MNFLKHHILIIGGAAVIAVGIIGYAIWGVTKPAQFAVVPVSRMNLQEEVHGDGGVKAAEAVDLAFERGGKITRVYAQAGDKVTAGQTIVSLDASDLAAQLAQVAADIKTQQARLDELKRGARPEDLQNQNISITNAQTALADARRAMVDKLQDAYTKADDAVRNKADQMFSNPQSSDPQVTFFITDSQLETDINWQRFSIESALKNWKTSLDTVTPESNFSPFLAEAKQNLTQINLFLEKLSLAINNPNNCVKSQGACQPISSGWKSDITTARGNINLAIGNLTAGEGSINTAQANLNSAMQGLTIKEAGTAPEQIIAQQAQVDRSVAAANLVRSQLAKTVLRAPFDGIISLQNAKVGSVASPNQTVVSVLSNAQYQVEIFVSETDIAKVSVGQTVVITLDAFGAEQFPATVIKTDPAATSVNGVDAYKVTLQFLHNDNHIKVGMGANVNISTAARTSVVAVPESAIITRGNDKIVLVKTNGAAAEERKVEVGISSANGYVEILSGLKEGENVAVFNGEQK